MRFVPSLERVPPHEQGAPIEHVACRRLTELGAIMPDGDHPGCPGWARVSVGTRAEIDFFRDRLSAVVGGGNGR